MNEREKRELRELIKRIWENRGITIFSTYVEGFPISGAVDRWEDILGKISWWKRFS